MLHYNHSHTNDKSGGDNMIFDLNVLPDKINHLENGNEIISTYELTIDNELFVAEYEKNTVKLCNTMRQLLFMFYHPFGITWLNGDDSFESLYNMFTNRKDIISITVEIEQTEFIDENVYGRNRKNVNCSFRLNGTDSVIYSNDIFN